MNLIYPFIIWGLLQIFTVEASTRPKQPISAKEKLLEYYDVEMQLLGKEFVKKAKDFSEKLLKDKLLEHASTPTLIEFKKNITDFLHNYQIYTRYNLNMQLLGQFVIATNNYFYEESNSDKDSRYILNLLKQQGYLALRDEYEVKFQKLIKEKLLTKFAKLKAQLMATYPKKALPLKYWYNNMTKCQDYICHEQHLNELYEVMNTPQDELLDYILGNLDHIYIYHISQANDLAKSILRDRKLAQLSSEIRQDLIQNINQFLKTYESSHDIDEIYKIVLNFHNNISMKFYYNMQLSTKDHQLLVNIFDRYGYAEFESTYKLKFNNFLKPGLYKLFDDFKAALSQEELEREQKLFKWFDQLKGLSRYADRVMEFAKLETLLKRV